MYMTKSIKTALVLAGGDGDRFYPLENKVCYRFNGKTVLQHIVESISNFVEEVFVITNPANDSAIRADLSSYTVKFVSQTNSDGGMADAVLAAEKFLNNDVIIFNGNDLIDFSFIPTLIEQTKNENTLLGFAAKRMDKYTPSGYVRFVEDKAVEIVEKPLPENIPSEYVRLVADYFPKIESFMQALHMLPATDDQYERGMSELMKQKPATCYKYEGDWTTLKYSWHVLSMQDYLFTHNLKKNIDSTVSIHPSSVIDGIVSIGKNVTIGAFVKISGPCFIGNNVLIGDHSLIRNSTINDDSIVGSGCEVARSYLGEKVMLHRNYVGDSVLGAYTSMGAGAVTANYRFDKKTIRTPVKEKMIDSNKDKFGLIAGKQVKIGVNSSTYPGVKLSPGTCLLPGEVITKDK